MFGTAQGGTPVFVVKLYVTFAPIAKDNFPHPQEWVVRLIFHAENFVFLCQRSITLFHLLIPLYFNAPHLGKKIRVLFQNHIQPGCMQVDFGQEVVSILGIYQDLFSFSCHLYLEREDTSAKVEKR